MPSVSSVSAVFNFYESQVTRGLDTWADIFRPSRWLAKFGRNCSPKFEKKQRKAKKHNSAGDIERDVPTGASSTRIEGLVPFIENRSNQRHVYCQQRASDTNRA